MLLAPSRGLRPMSRPVRLLIGWSLVALMAGAPWAYARFRHQACRNFHVVHEGRLYRSGQMTLAGLQHTIRDYSIRTVVNLRDGENDDDRAEEAYCEKAGVNFHRLPHLPWWASDGTVPAQENIDKLRAIVTDSKNWPVLVHCLAGNHRTGGLCAALRIDLDGWSNAKAIQEMRALGYSTIDGDLDILDYLQKYQPNRE